MGLVLTSLLTFEVVPMIRQRSYPERLDVRRLLEKAWFTSRGPPTPKEGMVVSDVRRLLEKAWFPSLRSANFWRRHGAHGPRPTGLIGNTRTTIPGGAPSCASSAVLRRWTSWFVNVSGTQQHAESKTHPRRVTVAPATNNPESLQERLHPLHVYDKICMQTGLYPWTIGDAGARGTIARARQQQSWCGATQSYDSGGSFVGWPHQKTLS